MKKDRPEEEGILAAVCHALSAEGGEVVSFPSLTSSAGVLIHHCTCSILDISGKPFVCS